MFSLFFYKNKNIIIFIFLLSLSIVSMSIQSSIAQQKLFTAFSTFSYPFTWLIDTVSRSISSTVEDFQAINEKIKKIEAFDHDYEKKKILTYQYDSVIQEYLRLRKLLEYQDLSSSNILFEEPNLSTQIADIIIKDPSSNYQSLIINKGTKHGIQENMPVIAFQIVKVKNQQEALKRIVVGKIAQVSYIAAKIVPITNPDCVIHVKLRGSEYTGLLQGYDKSKEGLILTHLNKTAKIKIGGEIITSGGQSIFPKGIQVGRIIKNLPIDSNNVKRVIVEPYIDFSRLQSVLVLKKEVSSDLIMLLNGKSDIRTNIIKHINRKEYDKAIELINQLKEKKK